MSNTTMGDYNFPSSSSTTTTTTTTATTIPSTIPTLEYNDHHLEQEQYSPIDSNQTYTLSGHNTSVNAVRFLRGSTSGMIASGDDKGQMFIWDMSRASAPGGMNITTTKHHKGEILDLHWLNSNEIITTSADSTAKIYNTSSGGHQSSRVTATFRHSHGGVNCAVSSREDLNPQLFATGGDNGHVNVWDRRFSSLPVHEIITKHPICAMECDSEMTKLYTAGVNDVIYGWDLVSGKQLFTTTIPNTTTTNNNNNTQDKSKTITMPAAIKTGLIGHTDVITSLSLSPDGSILTSYSADNTLRTWDIRPVVSEQRLANGRVINKYQGVAKQDRRRQQLHRHRLVTLPINNSNYTSINKSFVGLAAASADGNVLLYDLHGKNTSASPQAPLMIKNHTAAVHDVDTWGEWLVSCSADGNVILGAIKL